MNEIFAAFIKSAATTNTGGNCMADVIELKSGPVIFVTDECIGITASAKHWHEGPSEDYRGFEFEDVGCCARADNAKELSPCGLTFVERIGTFEPDGPVSVDLIVLVDGRVIGVDVDSMVLYPSMDAFDAITESGDTKDYPTMSLVAEGGDV